MKYYTSIYNQSQKNCFENYARSYLLKDKLDSILYHNDENYNKKTSKHKVFNNILEYLNKQYDIRCNNIFTNNQTIDFKISNICYNNCNEQKRCHTCIEMIYWNKLLNIIDTPSIT